MLLSHIVGVICNIMSDSGCNLTWCCKKCFPNNGAQFERQNEVRKSNKYSIIYLTASFVGLKSSVQWKGTQTREEVNIEISKSIIRVTAIYKNVYINDIEASGWGQIKNRWTHFPLCAHTHTWCLELQGELGGRTWQTTQASQDIKMSKMRNKNPTWSRAQIFAYLQKPEKYPKLKSNCNQAKRSLTAKKM